MHTQLKALKCDLIDGYNVFFKKTLRHQLLSIKSEQIYLVNV